MNGLTEFDWQGLVLDNLPIITEYTLKVLGAFIVILIGLRVAGWLSRLVKNYVIKSDAVDDTIGSFFASLVRWFVTAAVFIAALQVFGVPATSFVAVLGALTLAIGLSLQGALGNIASGVMIMLFRPYSLGEYIEVAGVEGTVRDINLFQTVLATSDNIKIIVPNSQAIEGIIKNYQGYATRRVDLIFSIDYSDNMDKAMNVIENAIRADKRVLRTPVPVVRIHQLGPSSVDITTRSWVRTDDYWEVKWELTKSVKSALDEAGLSIPYPHTVLVQKQGT